MELQQTQIAKLKKAVRGQKNGASTAVTKLFTFT